MLEDTEFVWALASLPIVIFLELSFCVLSTNVVINGQQLEQHREEELKKAA